MDICPLVLRERSGDCRTGLLESETTEENSWTAALLTRYDFQVFSGTTHIASQVPAPVLSLGVLGVTYQLHV